MRTEKLLPIRQMQGTDWDKHRKGISLAGSADMAVPFKNSISDRIIIYLLNAELNIVNYTSYEGFSFHIVAYVDKGFTPPPKGVWILDQIDELILELCVHIDAPRFAKVDKHEALQMIAQLMLDSIPKYLFNRTDFNGEKFYEDILPIIQPIADGSRRFRDEEFPL